MSTVCDTLALPEASTSRGLLRVQFRVQFRVQPEVQPKKPNVQPRVWHGVWPSAPQRSGQRLDSPMRSERVSRIPSIWLAERTSRFSQLRPSQPWSQTTNSSLSRMSASVSLPGSLSPSRSIRSVRRSHGAIYPARQVIPSAADVAPVGVAPVG